MDDAFIYLFLERKECVPQMIDRRKNNNHFKFKHKVDQISLNWVQNDKLVEIKVSRG